MASMTATRPARKSSRKAPAFSCKLVSAVVEISGQAYSVEPIDAHEEGTAAYRLVKHAADGAVYDCVRDHSGLVRCDCPSYVATHEGTVSLCKHGRALVALGFVPAPSPVPNVVEAAARRPVRDRFAGDPDGPAPRPAPKVVPVERPAPALGPMSESNPTLVDWDVWTNGPRPVEPTPPESIRRDGPAASWSSSAVEPTPAAVEPTPAPVCCEPTEAEPCSACVAIEPVVCPAGLEELGIDPEPADGDDQGDDDGQWDDGRWEFGPDPTDPMWGARRLPTGPTPTDAAWLAGYTQGKAEAEDTIRDLEMDNGRLTAAVDALRSELASERGSR